jgi:hypothetical protein
MLATTLPLMELHRLEEELNKTKHIEEEEALVIEEPPVDPQQEPEHPKVQLRRSQDTVELLVATALVTVSMEQPVIQPLNAESEQQLNEQDKTRLTLLSPAHRRLTLATQPSLAT